MGIDDQTLDPRTHKRAPVLTPALVRVFGPTGAAAERFALKEGETVIGRKVAAGQILLDDPRASRLHARVTRSGGRVEIANEATHGTHIGGALLPAPRRLSPGEVIRTGDSIFVFCMEPPLFSPETVEHGLIGTSQQMDEVRRQINLVGPARATVLLRGETGTGKEVVARALHKASGRSGPFVAVNCGAIPEQLAESQLFGHKAGAFTGATTDHPGYFAQADGGTLFLDEIGELSGLLQPKLLRVLDDKMITPVGGTAPKKIDVRLLAATHRDLDERVADERFRGDLYARISEVNLFLPPLHERREDIPLLFVDALEEGAPPVDPLLIERLLLYPWPFNVRELRKLAIDLSVRGAREAELSVELLGGRLEPPAATADSSATAEEHQAEGAPEEAQVVALLRAHKGVVSEVARASGRSRKQVYRWLKRFDLDPEQFR